MTLWPAEYLSLGQAADVIFGLSNIDGLTGATSLDHLKTQLTMGISISIIDLISMASWPMEIS